MLIIKSRLFYKIGVPIFLFLKLRWRDIFKLLFIKPKITVLHRKHNQNIFKEDDKTLVSIIQGDNIYAMLMEGLKLLGGLERLDIKGKSILIKPNIVNRYPSPANTNPLVIKYLIQLLRESGASQILIGDMSAIFALPTKKNAMKSGIFEVIQAEGASFVPFEDHGWVEVEIPEGRFVKKAMVSEIIFTVDRVINVPVIKTHSYANYSISLKNFIGAIHARQRPYFIAPEFWDEIVAELNAAYTPHLNILDGTKIFIKKGPTKGTIASPNLIVITGDRIAADVVGLSIINAWGGEKRIRDTCVWEQRQIKRAIELHLGVRSHSELYIVSKCLDTRKSNFINLIKEIQYYLNKQP